MKHAAIKSDGKGPLDLIPANCGQVTVGCLDVAGIVGSVIASSEKLRAEHVALSGTIAELELDQQRVGAASDEARQLSERAIEQLGQGTDLIQSSLGQISELLELVETLTHHVTGFAAAMEQVRKSSHDIEQIAETTNILALNATIEAMRAGDAGKTFAVVANEVKSLAGETHRATDEISRTIDALGAEANSVIEQIENGAAVSRDARSSVAKIEETIGSVVDLVEDVDRQNDEIARSTSTISDHVTKVQDVLHSFDNATQENETKLSDSNRKMRELERVANEMFNALIHADLSPTDSVMAAKAVEIGAEISALMEQAIADGSLSEDQLFDTDYIEISGSDPKRYRTSFTSWADANIRPILDRVQAAEPLVPLTSLADMNGWIPTHCSDRSLTPTGDIRHDTQYCRNGRMILENDDKRAKRSTADYMMCVYRQEGDGETYLVVRNVYVPIIVNGRRWGDYELPYSMR